MDIENLIGLAPNANVLVYQGPNSNSGSPGSGPYDTFSSIINQDRAQVVTGLLGQCEAALGQGNAISEASLFQQATVQGQSIVAASGDSGAEDCDTGGAPPQIQPAVDDPSSQPWVTGVGGTSIVAPGPPPTEKVWNSGGSLPTPAWCSRVPAGRDLKLLADAGGSADHAGQPRRAQLLAAGSHAATPPDIAAKSPTYPPTPTPRAAT